MKRTNKNYPQTYSIAAVLLDRKIFTSINNTGICVINYNIKRSSENRFVNCLFFLVSKTNRRDPRASIQHNIYIVCTCSFHCTYVVYIYIIHLQTTHALKRLSIVIYITVCRRGRGLRFAVDLSVHCVCRGCVVALPIAKYLPVDANARLTVVGKQYLSKHKHDHCYLLL